MPRVSFALVLATGIAALALGLGGAACESTLNLGDLADGGVADSAPPTCESTCDRLIVTCGLFTADKRGACLAECNQKGSRSDLACVEQTACADITKVCGDGTDGSTATPDGAALDDFEVRNCQAACGTSQFFECITASELSSCRALCATVPAAKRNGYQACANGAGGRCPQSRSCFEVLTTP